MIIQHSTSPSGVGSPKYLKNWLVPPPPTVLTQKCRFCHFHAVLGHFAQTVPPPVDPIWETLQQRFNVLLQLQFYNIFTDVLSITSKVMYARFIVDYWNTYDAI